VIAQTAHLPQFINQIRFCGNHRRGDKVVAHGLRGLPSNRKLGADTERDVIVILFAAGVSRPHWQRSTWRRSTKSM